ncbi:MAG: hypothetical protein EA369_09085 [Bradymonadales bacterium]|nr:MAG: hypothetical protein EA369_09085 [Bradymonadales bacterium]
MEKTRLCSGRRFSVWLLAFGLSMGFSAGLLAEEDEVVVQVEVRIERGDRAGALNRAREKAFEKALDQSLPASMSAEERARRLRRASRYIESFRLVSQSEEAGVLRAEFACQVIVQTEESVAQLDRIQDRLANFVIEFSWVEPSRSASIEEVRAALEGFRSTKVVMIRMRDGAWWAELSSALEPSRVFRSLAAKFRGRAQLRLVEDPRELWGVEGSF